MNWTDEERAEVTDPGRNEWTALVRDAKRYRLIREGRSAVFGDCYAMTFDEEGDYPVSHDVLDAAVDAAYKKRQEGK